MFENITTKLDACPPNMVHGLRHLIDGILIVKEEPLIKHGMALDLKTVLASCTIKM